MGIQLPVSLVAVLLVSLVAVLIVKVLELQLRLPTDFRCSR
jgi:hypothetical protein